MSATRQAATPLPASGSRDATCLQPPRSPNSAELWSPRCLPCIRIHTPYGICMCIYFLCIYGTYVCVYGMYSCAICTYIRHVYTYIRHMCIQNVHSMCVHTPYTYIWRKIFRALRAHPCCGLRGACQVHMLCYTSCALRTRPCCGLRGACFDAPPESKARA